MNSDCQYPPCSNEQLAQFVFHYTLSFYFWQLPLHQVRGAQLDADGDLPIIRAIILITKQHNLEPSSEWQPQDMEHIYQSELQADFRPLLVSYISEIASEFQWHDQSRHADILERAETAAFPKIILHVVRSMNA